MGLGKAKNGIDLKGRVTPFFETQSHRGTEKVAIRRQTVVLQSTVDSMVVALVSGEGGPGAPPYVWITTLGCLLGPLKVRENPNFIGANLTRAF